MTRIEELADAYWRERAKPGGTTINADGQVVTSDRAQEIYYELGKAIKNAAADNMAMLRSLGVPEGLLFTVSSIPPSVLPRVAAWQTPWVASIEALEDRLGDTFERVEDWSDYPLRVVWTNYQNAIVTYVENDLSIDYFFDLSLWAAGMWSHQAYYQGQQ